ncbi:MAG: response regulator transcription factor, partial [Gemmatimonadaceae bacterium]
MTTPRPRKASAGAVRREADKSEGPETLSTATPAKPAKPAKPPIELILIDDNRLLREGLASMIHAQPGFKVLAASADVEETLQKVRESKPDVVLLDLGLEDHDSLSLTATVHAEVPEAKVIVMGLLPFQEDVADYVRAGASGFIMKDTSFEDFFTTIRTVAGGEQV